MSKPTLATQKKKRPRGRPTDYSPAMCDYLDTCEGSNTVLELAKHLKIEPRTFWKWMERFPEFVQAVKRARQRADRRVESALYERAIGYEHPEEKVFQHQGLPVIVPTTKRFAPSDLACMFWLKNRDPENWRDRIEHEVKTEPIQFIVHLGDDQRRVYDGQRGQVEGDVVDVEHKDPPE